MWLKEKRAGGLDLGPEEKAGRRGLRLLDPCMELIPQASKQWRITIRKVCGEQDMSTSSSDKSSQTAPP